MPTAGDEDQEVMMKLRTLLVVASATAMTAACTGGIATKSDDEVADKGGPVLIGAPYPLTGIWAENGQNSVHGMKLAAQEINAAGGIKALGGAKIKIVSTDTSSEDPGQAKSVTDGMLNDQDISALVGSYLSSMTLTSVLAAEDAQVPMITQSYVDELTQSGYKYLFQIAPKASAFGSTTVADLIALSKAQGHPTQTIAVIDGDDASAKAQAASVVGAAKKQGLKVVADITYPDGLSDASSIVGKVAATKPDVIVAGGALADIALIIRGIRARGITAPIANPGGGGTLTPQFASTLGKYANGILSTSAWNYDLQLPGVAAATKEYQQQYNQPMPQEAGESWAAVYDIAAAIEKSGSKDPQAIRDALASMEFDSTPASAVPPGKVAFTASGANQFIKPILVQWQNGRLRTVYPSNVATTQILSSTWR